MDKKKADSKVELNEQDLRERLSPLQYHVTREKGTEMAFTGQYYDMKQEGVYRCIVCDEELFSSEHKYDSGSGWPSFWTAFNEEAVCTRLDTSLSVARDEVLCSNCGSHLGHMFPDGPLPTGIRYCINSAALRFRDKHAE